MTLFNFIKDNLPILFLVFIRTSTIFMVIPIFGSRNVPINIKLLFSLFMTILVLPFVLETNPKVPQDAYLFILAILKEMAVGLTIGFTASLIFDGMILAGQFIGLQIGFGQANVFNPHAEQQIPLIGEFYFLLTLFVFLSINGHHWLILAFQKSFTTVPLDGFIYNPIIVKRVLFMVTQIFVIAMIIAIPICGVITLLDLIMGIMARTMPQMNILIIGFSIKIFVGFITMIITMPFLYIFLTDILTKLLAQLMRLFL